MSRISSTSVGPKRRDPVRRNPAGRLSATATIGAILATALTFMSPIASSATDAPTDVALGTASAYSSISAGALTVGAGANVAGSAVVGAGAASTTGAGASVGAAVAGIAQAQADLQAAYTDAASRTPTAFFGGDIGRLTFTTGVYNAGAAVGNTGIVTLDARGNPDAVFIFQIGAAFSSSASSSIVLANGAQARHVYWQVLGAVTIGANSTFAGTLMADGAVTIGAETVITGRTLSISGAVTLGVGMGALGVPEISITNSPAPSDLVFDGETITYTFVVANTGNVALTVPPIVVNGIPGVSDVSYAWSGNPGKLLPKEFVTGTATYLATFDDAVKRHATATAGVVGTSSTGVMVIAAKTKTVVVWPIPVIDAVTAPQGVATTFDVLTNDQTLPTGVGFSRTQLTVNPRAIGAAKSTVPSSPIFGSVTCSDTGKDRGFCTYRSADLFTGVDGFDYSVSQLGRSWNVHVTVTVSVVAVPPIARDDRAVATTGGAPVVLSPLANDTDNNAGTLIIVSADALPPGQGAFTCSSSACSYLPPTNGFVGTVVAHYAAADQSSGGVSGPTSTGTITIFVDAATLAQQGFTSSPTAVPAVSAGDWKDTALIEAPISSCVSSRPQASLSWTAIARATSWTVQRRNVSRSTGLTPSAWNSIALLPGTAHTFLDDRVGESNDFQYRVRPDLYRWEGVFSDASSLVKTSDALSAAGC